MTLIWVLGFIIIIITQQFLTLFDHQQNILNAKQV